jgi:WD40 repeat protein
MDRNWTWILAGFLAASSLTFGAAGWLLSKSGMRIGQASASRVDTADKPASPSSLDTSDTRPPRAENEAVKPESQQKAQPVASSHSPLILQRFVLPGRLAGDAKSVESSWIIRALRFEAGGNRLIVSSKELTSCLDCSAAKILQTFKGPNRLGPPDTIAVDVSPDGQTLVIPDDEGKDLIIWDALKGQQLGACRTKKASARVGEHLGAFTPFGTFFVFLDKNEPGFYATSTSQGTFTRLSIPLKKQTAKTFERFIPIPHQSVFLVMQHGMPKESIPSSYMVLELQTGKLLPITALHIKPAPQGPEPDWLLSPDERLLLVQSHDAIEICDWRANQLVFSQTGFNSAWHGANFTPDSGRVLFINHSNSTQTMLDTRTGSGSPDRICLYEVSSQKCLADFVPGDFGLSRRIEALTVSPDGRKIAIANDTSIDVLDFAEAFHVSPLPPRTPAAVPELLPERS